MNPLPWSALKQRPNPGAVSERACAGCASLPDNTPMGFVDALVKRVREALGYSWWYPNEQGEDAHTPFVHAQNLPMRFFGDPKPDESRYYPLVRVRLDAGTLQSLDAADLVAVIQFCGWDESGKNEGWRIPAAMMWAVLTDLLDGPLMGAYELIPPVEWHMPEDGIPPYYVVDLYTTWRRAMPVGPLSGGETRGLPPEMIHFDKE